jgi:hypothetical protein
MPGSISDFRASFSTDLARPSKFDVFIPIPISLARAVGADSRILSMRCENATLPGRNMQTTEKKMGSAPIEKFPYHTMYGEVNFTFIISDDMSEKIFFDSWMDTINPTTDYNFQYKSNYAVDININQYDVTNEITYTATLYEAYPISMNDMDLDWNNEQYHKMTVVFSYKRWVGSYTNSLQQSIVNSALTGILNTVTQA